MTCDKGVGMTELLYYSDAYCQSFDATVSGVETQEGKTRVALDRTAFYPGGGGQPNPEAQRINREHVEASLQWTRDLLAKL